MELSGLIEVGLVREDTFEVEMAHSAAQVGSGPALSQDGSLEVLSTPGLIVFMERVPFRMLQERLPDDLTSVGVSVQASHKAPTLVGGKVRVRAVVGAVEGRRVNSPAAGVGRTGAGWRGDGPAGGSRPRRFHPTAACKT